MTRKVFMTSAEAAQKWECEMRVVRYSCQSGRVPGAMKLGRDWLIPAGAKKPLDRRRK